MSMLLWFIKPRFFGIDQKTKLKIKNWEKNELKRFRNLCDAMGVSLKARKHKEDQLKLKFIESILYPSYSRK